MHRLIKTSTGTRGRCITVNSAPHSADIVLELTGGRGGPGRQWGAAKQVVVVVIVVVLVAVVVITVVVAVIVVVAVVVAGVVIVVMK